MPIKSMIIKPKRILKTNVKMQREYHNHKNVHLNKNKILPRECLLLPSNHKAIKRRDLHREGTLPLPRDHHQREDLQLVGPLLIIQEATMVDHKIMTGTTTGLNTKEDSIQMIQGNNNSMTIMSLSLNI